MMKYLCFFVLSCLCLSGFAQTDHPKQYNSLGVDFVGEAPWRMKKTDSAGNLNGIPVHIFIKDANVVGNNAELIYLDIFVKNASSSSFGGPLIFNNYSSSAFNSMFSAKSVYNPSLDVQSFDASLPAKSSDHSIMFTASNCAWPDNCTYVDITHSFWYCTFTIPPEMLVGLDDIVDVEVYFSLNWQTDEQRYTRVFRYDDDVPKLAGWYRGDTHYHSMYTNNTAEFGLPISSIKIAGKDIGLDWVTVTDHSCDYDNYGTSIQSNWNFETSDIAQQNAIDSSMIMIHGEEVSTNNSAGEVVHMLCYPPDSLPYSLPYLGDGNGDVTATSLSIDEILYPLSEIGGFAYAAHPFAAYEKLSSIINGGIWNVSDTAFYPDGAALPGHDNVICNDPGYASDLYSQNLNQLLFKSQIRGGEIWNCRISMFTTDDASDPWNVTHSSSITPFVPFDTTNVEWHYNRLLQNLEVLKFLNRKGLKMKNLNPLLQHYRFYLEAGSDGHGSFNYSNTDFVMGVVSNIHDNALGKVSTVAYCPSGMGNAGSNVLKAMENGNVVMSDGPLATIGLSTDGNNNTDEYIVGQEALLTLWDYIHTKVRIVMATTPEYGTFHQLHIIAGTKTREYSLLLPVDSTVQNKTYVYSLDSLLTQIMAGNSIQQNEYFYLRVELTTHKEYGAVASLHERQDEIFRCYTNPIWIRKPLSITTSTDNITSNEYCSVYPNPFTSGIQIDLLDNNSPSVTALIYNMVGGLVKAYDLGNAKGIGQHFVLETTGLPANIYMMKVIAGNKKYYFKIIKTTND